MSEEGLLRHLRDPEVLLQAYAASSAYVLRQAYQIIPELQAFRDKETLVSPVLEQLQLIRQAPGHPDPVVVGAHLYALEIAGAEPETARAVASVLRDPVLRDDPLLGQLAGQIGASLLKKAGSPAPTVALTKITDGETLEGIALALEEGGDGR